MKILLRLESTVLFGLLTFGFFNFTDGSILFFFLTFFAPDLAFILLIFNKKATILVYNLTHHLGFIAVIIAISYLLSMEVLLNIGIVFMAHAYFDRSLGIGLKYFDHINHTHLGWIGKKPDALRAENLL